MSAVWNCPTCNAANVPRVAICEGCGYERPGAPPTKSEPLPVYREMPKRAFARALPSDRCTEAGCDLTVAQHQEQLKAALTRIGARQIASLGFSRRRLPERSEAP